jgi:threonine dehydrogenase-like Zn-dependent dehydrogenase
VFGQGPVGLSATMLATARGASVIAVDPAPARLEAATRFGAEEVIDPSRQDPVAAIRDLTGRGAYLVIETSGVSQAMQAAARCAAAWGRVCLVGIGGTVEIGVAEFIRSQITVVTSWLMSTIAMQERAGFVASRNLPIDELFTHRWRLDQASEAYRVFNEQSAGKGVFIF